MTKPDDIDQDAWDTGVRMAGEYLSWLNAGNSAGHLSEHAVAAMADTIARAIMSARAEEREACAKVADDFIWCLPLYEKGADANIASDDAACAVQADIAAAIRNRP